MSSTFLLLAAGGTAACDNAQEREEDYRFQCAVERPVDGQVVTEAVDCDDVDDDNGHAHHGGGYYPVIVHGYPVAHAPAAPTVGSKLPADGRAVRIGYKDAAGRQRFGLPPSGRIGNSTVKANVVGKGGAAAGTRGFVGAGKGGSAGG